MRKTFLRPKEVPLVSRKDLHDPWSHQRSWSSNSGRWPVDSHLLSTPASRTGVAGRVLLLGSRFQLLAVSSRRRYSRCSSPSTPEIWSSPSSLEICSSPSSAEICLDTVVALFPSSSPSGRPPRHTACSNFDLGRSGQRSWRDLVRPVSVISTVLRDDGRSNGEFGLESSISSLWPLRPFVLLASGRLAEGCRLLAPGLAVSVATSGFPLLAVRSVFPGEFSRLSISMGSGPRSSTSTGAVEDGVRWPWGYPSSGICEAGIKPVNREI